MKAMSKQQQQMVQTHPERTPATRYDPRCQDAPARRRQVHRRTILHRSVNSPPE